MFQTTLYTIALLVAHVFATDVEDATDAKWGYVMGSEDPLGPDKWGQQWAACDGTSQSPIAIVADETVYAAAQSLQFHMDDTHVDGRLNQNGHSLVIHPGALHTMDTTETEGDTTRTWNFAQGHFHWGSTSSTGSEHTLNGFHYAAEMHFVHTMVDSDDLMVVGVLFEEGDANTEVQELIDLIDQLKWNDTSVEAEVNEFNFDAILPMLPDTLTEYYKYSGSLTTPGCSEVVSWRVMKEIKSLSSAQLQRLRNISTDADSDGVLDLITTNWRPTQPLNGRTVYRTFDAPTESVALRELTFGDGYITGWIIFGVYAGVLIVSFGIILPPRLKNAAAQRAEEAEMKRKRNENYEKQRAEAEKAMNEKKSKSN